MQEKLERKSSAAAAVAAATAPLARPQQQQSPLDTLIDDQPAGRSSPMPRSPPKPKQPDTNSLLGLDIFGTAPAPSPRPSSVNSDPGKMSSSRPDLNRSILSLYASSPKPQQPKMQSPTMGNFGSPLQTSMMPPPQQQQQSAYGDLNSSFSGLNFSATDAPPAAPPKPSPFANLTASMKKTAAAPQLSKPASGGFFTPAPAKPSPVSASSGLEGLFDFGASAAPQAQAPVAPVALNNGFSSLSFDADAWVTPAATTSAAANSSNAWGTPSLSSNSSANAWGSSAPVSRPPVQQSYVSTTDDDWGNFSSGTTTTAPVAPVKVTPGASGLDDDLFGNVWK